MSITELRDKYHVWLIETNIATEYFMTHSERQWLRGKSEMIAEIISDLNALIQSEDKERRELLQKFIDYIYKMALSKTKISYDQIVDRFLESEKGGEG